MVSPSEGDALPPGICHSLEEMGWRLVIRKEAANSLYCKQT